MKRFTWTKATIEEARAIFESHTTMADALAACSAKFKHPITRPSVDCAFRTNGKRTPSSYLASEKQAAAPPPDPVVVKEKRDETARLRREHADLVDRLREANKRAGIVERLRGAYESPRIEAREKSGMREMTAVVLASDWHVEETVDPAAVAGRNAYNLEIADARIKRFFDAACWNVEHHRASGHVAVRDMVLWLGGDLISGYIHEELVESNALSPTESLLWLLPRLRNGIATLLQRLELERLVIPCSYGNHGRTTMKTRVSTGAHNSYEWLLYNVLSETFATTKRVQFEVTESAHQYVDVYDRTLHFHHGDSVKYQGGVGGISVPLLRAKPGWDLVRRSDVSCVGHFHQYSDFGRVVCNGSLIGFGPYSQHIRASFEPPQQAFFMVDKARGKCQSTPLWVDDARSERAA